MRVKKGNNGFRGLMLYAILSKVPINSCSTTNVVTITAGSPDRNRNLKYL